MGYYLPHRSYLRPRQKARATQKIVAISTGAVMVTAAIIIFTSLEFGNNKTALADSKPEILAVKSLSPLEVKVPAEISKKGGMPAELAFFNVDFDGERTNVKFATQLEYDVDYFTIERSQNGNPFEEVACLESNGGASLGGMYTFTDETAPKGLLFYRLRQTSDNGKSIYLGIQKVLVNPDEANLSLYIDHVGPEPFDKYINIGYYSDRAGGVSVEIFDRDGKNIYKSYTMANEGYNTCRFIEGADLLQQDYTIRIANSTGAYVRKIRKRV